MTTTPTPSESPLSAGAVPELPVVAIIDRAPMVDPLFVHLNAAFSIPFGKHGLTPHAPAQATIERLTRERYVALRAAFGLTKAYGGTFEDQNAEIDSLKSRLVKRDTSRATIAAQAAEIERLKRELAGAYELLHCTEDEKAALKAKQVADVEAVMRLADEWVVEAIHAALAANTGHATLADPDAAREALRSALTKDRT